MRKLALAIVLLASTSVLAAEQWTEEEQTSGVKKVEYVRYAFAGQKMKLQLLSAMDMDCSIVEGWAFEITKQPEHGTAEIVPTTAFPTYPKENPRHRLPILPAAQQLRLRVAFSFLASMVAAHTAPPSGANALQ